MKALTLISLILMVATASAKRGDDVNKDAFKRTAAGFAAESVEHSLMRLAQFDAPALTQSVVNAEVEINGMTSSVLVTFLDGSTMTYACQAFDAPSRGGSIIKREVLCRR